VIWELVPYLAASVGLFAVGLHGLVVRQGLLRKVIALNVMGTAVFLLLVTIARRNADPEPDPVPQAMVLTGIVVTVALTSFALALLRRLHAATGRDSFEGEARR
jgi:multicomponent Na+:H+ antiporter subunit C